MNGRDDSDKKGLWRKLPVVKTKNLGKLGPAFGFGVGCGFGVGVGFVGGVGLGIPGSQIGFVLGAGCGVGLGFGYGVGRGVARDWNRRYSNVGNMFGNFGGGPTQDDITGLLDEFVTNTRKLIRTATREIEKRTK